jgi:hypothetical protein
VPRPIPIARPLPNISDHVVEAVTIGLEAGDRRGDRLQPQPRLFLRDALAPPVATKQGMDFENGQRAP